MMANARVGAAFLDEGFNADGVVELTNAEINGVLRMHGASLHNPGGRALYMDGISASDTFLSRLSASGEVRARGAHLGSLDLSGAELRAAPRPAGSGDGRVYSQGQDPIHALVLDATRIDGDLNAAVHHDAHGESTKMTVCGEFRAAGAEIGGQLLFSGASLSAPDGVNALNLSGAHIDDSVFLDEGFSATQIFAPQCVIKGRLDLERAGPIGSINMSFSQVGVLALGITTPTPSEVVATGWRLGEIHDMFPVGNKGAVRNAYRNTLVEWLRTTPTRDFAVQPWLEVASVFERQGRPGDARWIRVRVAREVTARVPWWMRPARSASRWFTGYGYHTLRPAIWLIATVAMAMLIVWSNQSAFLALDSAVANQGFNPWVYGLVSVVPAINLAGVDKWLITDWGVAWSLLALKLFAWLQTALLLAGMTGLLKKS